MERAVVSVDGGYLDAITQELQIRVDYAQLVRKLCGASSFIRAYYYHCLPYQSNPPTHEERDRFSRANTFFDRLSRLDRFEVRLGKLVMRGRYDNGHPIFNQKRVDVFFATDLVKFSARRAIDQAILLTADSDYVPAIEAAREFGIIVKLAYYQNLPINDELLGACDERFAFGPQFFDDILR